jgi:hypothetical protein
MKQKKHRYSSPKVRGCWITIGILALLFSLPAYFGANLMYYESKGPFKNWMQVVDLDGDGDLDVIVSHTRWEDVDLSWAGIGLWINQGDGTFKLMRDRGTETWPYPGAAAGAGDVDQDGDTDIFTNEFYIKLRLNQGGLQEGEPGTFRASGGIETPPNYDQGYHDMGGTIALGDLNGDGWPDVFVAGCCYGLNAMRPDYDGTHAPSVSWAWINQGRGRIYQEGYILPMDFLDGRPIRQVALGDLDGDGDLDIYAAVGRPTMGTTDSMDDLILLNDGTGNLTPFDQPLGNTDSTSVALGDVNGDGHLDALVGTSTGAILWINQRHEVQSGEPLLVLAEQSFEAEQTVKNKLQTVFSAAADALFSLYLPYGSIRTQAVFLADLDGDGDLDALLARLWAAEIWWNDGTGVYSPSDVRFEYREDKGVAVADFDGDGNQDIFVGRNQDDYQLWLGSGDGSFTSAPHP